MTHDRSENSANESTIGSAGSYTADIATDPELDTTVISLLYKDAKNPAHNITVGIAPELGSNLFRFRAGEHDIIYSERAVLQRKGFTGNFVLWPLPNRIRDQRYTFNGQTYSLKGIERAPGDSALIHGLVFDRPWQHGQPLADSTSASVTTSIDITPESPFYAGYPFPSRLSLMYRLTSSGLAITYQVENKGDQTLPYGFALHPYISLLSGPDNTFVSVPANAVMETDDQLLPTGRVFEVNKTMYAMYDLRQPKAISTLKLDHAYTDVLPAAAVIDFRKQSLQLQISATEDFSHIVVYTLAETPSFCVEHQTCSTDAVNLNNEGPELRKIAHLLEIQPGETGTGSIYYTLHHY